MKNQRKQMFRYLAVLSIASTAGLQGWRTLFNNFAVEVAHINGSQMGMLQSIREIPGFLALLAVFVLLIIREHRLSAFSVLILGVGVGLTGLFPTYYGLMITTLIMSFGFHYYETTNQSLTLQYFDKQTSPWVFGKLRSYSAASSIVVGLFIFAVSPILEYREIYLIVGGGISLLAIWGFTQDPSDRKLPVQHHKLLLRKKYWLFYLLTLMSGARRQIFVAFAVFLMVKRFGFSVQTITILFVVNNVVNYFISPLIGKAIVRFGERWILSIEYFSLIFVFLAYAFTHSTTVVIILYILDHIFFNFSIAIRTYFQKIGDTADIAPSMAVGFTINHIAAVVFPVVGGLFWMLDYRIPFLGGAVISLISLLAVQKIRIKMH